MPRTITIYRVVDRMTRSELVAEVERLSGQLNGSRDLQSLVHDLQASQEEVLLQNDSLQRAQHLLEVSRNQFAELYDFAPLAYCILDRNGVVKSINLTGCAMLECERSRIEGMPCLRHVVAGDRRLFLEHMRRCRAGQDPVTTELRLQTGGKVMPAQFFSRPAHEADRVYYRTAITDLTERQQAVKSRRQLLRQLMAAQEAERERFSRELHDQMGQYLTALSLGLKSLHNQLGHGPLLEQVQQLEKIVDELGREAHDLAIELRPTALDDLGLEAALAHYVEKWSQRYRLPVDFQNSGLDSRRLGADVETAVYRVVQEALTNIARHAQAQRVSLIVTVRSDHLSVVIEDDGRGFDVDETQRPSLPKQRLGLLGMEERISLVAGSLEIESGEGQGTTIFVRIPLSD